VSTSSIFANRDEAYTILSAAFRRAGRDPGFREAARGASALAAWHLADVDWWFSTEIRGGRVFFHPAEPAHADTAFTYRYADAFHLVTVGLIGESEAYRRTRGKRQIVHLFDLLYAAFRAVYVEFARSRGFAVRESAPALISGRKARATAQNLATAFNRGLVSGDFGDALAALAPNAVVVWDAPTRLNGYRVFAHFDAVRGFFDSLGPPRQIVFGFNNLRTHHDEVGAAFTLRGAAGDPEKGKLRLVVNADGRVVLWHLKIG
jgi:hypothetical protein